MFVDCYDVVKLYVFFIKSASRGTDTGISTGTVNSTGSTTFCDGSCCFSTTVEGLSTTAITKQK